MLQVAYDESVDLNNTMISGGGTPGFGPSSIDEAALSRDANCTPVHSYQYLRTNTVFEVGNLLEYSGCFAALIVHVSSPVAFIVHESASHLSGTPESHTQVTCTEI